MAERIPLEDRWVNLVRVMRTRPVLHALGLTWLVVLTAFLLVRQPNTTVIQTGERIEGVVTDKRVRTLRRGGQTFRLNYSYEWDRSSEGQSTQTVFTDEAQVSEQFFSAYDIGDSISVYVLDSSKGLRTAVEDNGRLMLWSRIAGGAFALFLIGMLGYCAWLFAIRRRDV